MKADGTDKKAVGAKEKKFEIIHMVSAALAANPGYELHICGHNLD